MTFEAVKDGRSTISFSCCGSGHCSCAWARWGGEESILVCATCFGGKTRNRSIVLRLLLFADTIFSLSMPHPTMHVALLRGINVGGNNVIKMDALRACFERMGFARVRTYIASGNVIFEAPKEERAKLEARIEAALRKEFGYKATVLVRTAPEMAATVAHFPAICARADWKHNVIFLGEDIDSKAILKACNLKEGIEETSYYKGVLFWSAKMVDITKSNMLKLSAQPIYQKMTVRSINTTRKLAEMLEETL